MKIVKTISKLKEGYISALCINTGPNTFKANQYSNILYLFERKIEYKKMYDIFGEGRKNIIFLIIGFIIGFLGHPIAISIVCLITIVRSILYSIK